MINHFYCDKLLLLLLVIDFFKIFKLKLKLKILKIIDEKRLKCKLNHLVDF